MSPWAPVATCRTCAGLDVDKLDYILRDQHSCLAADRKKSGHINPWVLIDKALIVEGRDGNAQVCADLQLDVWWLLAAALYQNAAAACSYDCVIRNWQSRPLVRLHARLGAFNAVAPLNDLRNGSHVVQVAFKMEAHMQQMINSVFETRAAMHLDVYQRGCGPSALASAFASEPVPAQSMSLFRERYIIQRSVR